jgi:hypothetical protein
MASRHLSSKRRLNAFPASGLGRQTGGHAASGKVYTVNLQNTTMQVVQYGFIRFDLRYMIKHD